MSEKINLSAKTRQKSGKGISRALRREGDIPAIIYGGPEKEILISTNLRELAKQYEKGHFTSKVVNLNVDGNVIAVLPKQIQLDPVTDKPIHVDFYRINKDTKIRVLVAVEFINAEKSPGLKRGGVLNVVRRDIELLCSTDSIPEKVTIDLNGLQIGESIHVSHVHIPTGATPTITDRDFTIATIVGRTSSTTDDETSAATQEGDASSEENNGNNEKADN